MDEKSAFLNGQLKTKSVLSNSRLKGNTNPASCGQCFVRSHRPAFLAGLSAKVSPATDSYLLNDIEVWSKKDHLLFWLPTCEPVSSTRSLYLSSQARLSPFRNSNSAVRLLSPY